MSEISKYAFLPHLRKGLTVFLTTPDGGSETTSRSSVNIKLDVKGNKSDQEFVDKDIDLYGPADVVGIDPNSIVRTEPHDGSEDFLSNFLSFIEFYEEDFPWAYNPFAPEGVTPNKKLRPWLTLAVLEFDEFDNINTKSTSLGAIKIKNTAYSLPNPNQLWAWAHTQVNAVPGISGADNDYSVDLSKIKSKLSQNPNSGVSRIICPRKLKPGVQYFGFLIPTFEVGRLAGLGEDIGNQDFQEAAWEENQESEIVFPYYYRWSFKTSEGEDFKTLVMKLNPQVAHPSMGKRPMEISNTNYPELDNLFIKEEDNLVQKTLLLEGVLAQVSEHNEPGLWDSEEAEEYKEVLKDFLHLSETGSPDPIITPEIYGKWHANSSELNPNGSGWLDVLNLDPRNRVAAGVGAEVVRKNQEFFMDLAWKRLGQLDEVNSVIITTRLCYGIASATEQHHFNTLATEEFIGIWSGSHSRFADTGTGKTVAFAIDNNSPLSASVISADFRSCMRPGGDLAVACNWDGSNFLANVNSQSVALVPDRPGTVSSQYAVSIDSILNATEKDSAFISVLPQLEDFVLTTAGTSLSNNWTVAQGGSFDVSSVHFNDATAVFVSNMESVEETIYLAEPVPPSINLTTVRADIAQGISTVTNFSTLINYRVASSPHSPQASILHRNEVMAYPAIDITAYEYLEKISPDFIIPNFDKVEPESITMLQLNNRFVNSFFVGMNHEMSREMLWRKYPTDMRGSYFRKFWKNTIPTGETDPVELNKYRDISPIHGWGLNDDLDDNRKPGVSPTSKPLVMVIRGELIEQFPHVNIYAQQAQWNLDTEDEIIATEPRIGASTKIDPIFYGYLEPDVMLVGFDLTEAEAKGTWGEEEIPTKLMDPGWFFVLEERAGDTRFGAGMPVGTTGWNLTPQEWDLLHWGHIANRMGESDINEINYIDIDITLASGNPTTNIVWSNNAANMGVIFCRNATKVLIHASNMLNQTI
jgi:hypothetical protein